MSPNRFNVSDFNKLVDELDNSYYFDEELIEPQKESLEEYLLRKRQEQIRQRRKNSH